MMKGVIVIDSCLSLCRSGECDEQHSVTATHPGGGETGDPDRESV